jgi:hypothetical protein
MIDFLLGPALGQDDLALMLIIAQNLALVIIIVLLAKRHLLTTTTAQAHRAIAQNIRATQPERHKLLIFEAPSGGNRGLPPLSERAIQNAGQRPPHRPSPRSGGVAAFFPDHKVIDTKIRLNPQQRDSQQHRGSHPRMTAFASREGEVNVTTQTNANASPQSGPELAFEVMSEICAIIESYLPADRAPSALTTKALIAGLAGSFRYLIACAPANYRCWDQAITKLDQQLRSQLDAQFANRPGPKTGG